MIADGFYAVLYSGGQHRTVRIRTTAEDDWVKGKTVLELPVGSGMQKWVGIAFLEDSANYESGIRVRFWKSFRMANPFERQHRIQRAIDRIARDPAAAQLAFVELQRKRKEKAQDQDQGQHKEVA